MKKSIFFLLFLIIACSGNKTNKKSVNLQMDMQNANLVTYKFKVDGLQDTLISDSIWKMIFKFPGIDNLVISKTDSSVIFKIEPKLISAEALKAEITKRGGKIINTLPR
jgi:hypothetical protein